MFVTSDTQKKSFLEHTKAAREERAYEKRREEAAVRIQAQWKGYIARKQYRNRIITDFDNLITNDKSEKDFELLLANTVYPVVRRFLTYFQCKKEALDTLSSREKFESLCRYLNKSMESDSPKLSYAALCLHKDRENHADSISLALYLHTLVVFTSPKSWGILRNKQFEKMQPALQKYAAIFREN
ncbi:unnamed protein product [Ceratitis capitata]|uniref:HECT-type E3 ubiquitin transferase n=1 Tax=Ceratitis capitata TaxID=7213 RepID=A0A811V070_CERCA|nr:unnamed protein product [Ceratitis capitata]